ncbi:helix-turn-helix transcriptional regulator [Streptomyces sp. TRM 70351]|uniref:helix-turn-helix transcriptional regulator n=1 Tax=Streptomyces sp. TRM 70351 TaxID=3116552 RepID=UPI002E7B5998|nr:helix-turn-helix transcriptional regulator [Streptomyces sp. TRM 70351]MEE1931449.1 helix-turn-helix transcriptional regulator [Streptomyces sp. TRM 70351]
MGNLLEPLGVDATCELVYREMLTHPGEGVAALAHRLGLSTKDVGNALHQLSSLALVRQSYELSGRQRPVNPEVAMKILLERQKAELEAHQHRLALSRAAATQLIAEASEAMADPQQLGVELLVGIDRIREWLSQLATEVQDEVLTFAPDGAQTQDNMDASRPLNLALLQRGVRLRTIYLESIRSDAPTLDHVRSLIRSGAEVRTAPLLPTRMIITDRRLAMLPVDGHDSGRGAVVFSESPTVQALHALFESVWERARVVGGAPPSAKDADLAPQDAAALKLLAEGHTVESIAKRLGVSPRTARRITTSLQDRLGARGRFDAGVKAVRRGWLPMRD